MDSPEIHRSLLECRWGLFVFKIKTIEQTTLQNSTAADDEVGAPHLGLSL